MSDYVEGSWNFLWVYWGLFYFYFENWWIFYSEIFGVFDLDIEEFREFVDFLVVYGWLCRGLMEFFDGSIVCYSTCILEIVE